MSLLRNTSTALLTLFVSTQVYAMDADRDGAPRPATVSPRTQAEKDALRAAIANAVANRDAQHFNDVLIQYEPKEWFSQKAFEFMFVTAANHKFDSIVEYLLARPNRFPLSQQCLMDVYTSRQSEDVKLSILNLVAQRDIRNPLLTQVNLEEALPLAAARGRLGLVQRIVTLPQDCFAFSDACRLHTMKSAAAFGELETVEFLFRNTREHGLLTKKQLNEMWLSAMSCYKMHVGSAQYRKESQNRLAGLRSVVNFLLNLNENGPDQEEVDTYFSSAAEYCPEVNLLRVILMDPITNQLRTGLRPSNHIINSAKMYCFDPESKALLNSIVLESPPQPQAAPQPAPATTPKATPAVVKATAPKTAPVVKKAPGAKTVPPVKAAATKTPVKKAAVAPKNPANKNPAQKNKAPQKVVAPKKPVKKGK